MIILSEKYTSNIIFYICWTSYCNTSTASRQIIWWAMFTKNTNWKWGSNHQKYGTSKQFTSCYRLRSWFPTPHQYLMIHNLIRLLHFPSEACSAWYVAHWWKEIDKTSCHSNTLQWHLYNFPYIIFIKWPTYSIFSMVHTVIASRLCNVILVFSCILFTSNNKQSPELEFALPNVSISSRTNANILFPTPPPFGERPESTLSKNEHCLEAKMNGVIAARGIRLPPNRMEEDGTSSKVSCRLKWSTSNSRGW